MILRAAPPQFGGGGVARRGAEPSERRTAELLRLAHHEHTMGRACSVMMRCDDDADQQIRYPL
jgi:hypothetical protein